MRDITLKARWVPNGGMYQLEFFCIGKWRPSIVRARRPRPFTKADVQKLHRQVYLNTGREFNLVGLEA